MIYGIVRIDSLRNCCQELELGSFFSGFWEAKVLLWLPVSSLVEVVASAEPPPPLRQLFPSSLALPACLCSPAQVTLSFVCLLRLHPPAWATAAQATSLWAGSLAQLSLPPLSLHFAQWTTAVKENVGARERRGRRIKKHVWSWVRLFCVSLERIIFGLSIPIETVAWQSAQLWFWPLCQRAHFFYDRCDCQVPNSRTKQVTLV